MFLAHKVILAAVSAFFNSMFSHNFKENREKRCDPEGVTSEALRVVLEAIYTSQLELNFTNNYEVYAAVHIFQLSEMMMLCRGHITDTVSIRNCLQLIELGEKYNDEQIVRCSKKCLLSNFEEIYTDPEFDDLSLEAVAEYLEKAEISVHKEHIKFRAAKKWIMAEAERECHAADLMEIVNFFNIPSATLTEDVKDASFIFEENVSTSILVQYNIIPLRIPTSSPS